MPASGSRPDRIAVQVGLVICISLELSRPTWLITSLVFGGGDKLSRHSLRGGDVAGLLDHLAKLREEAHARAGVSFSIITIQKPAWTAFWINRVLERAGIERHVVNAASILTSRRPRRAKTDRIDGETLRRTRLAYKRGEPRVCTMVKAPGPEEDRRRLLRERKTLAAHVKRAKGLLFAPGISPRASPITSPWAMIDAGG